LRTQSGAQLVTALVVILLIAACGESGLAPRGEQPQAHLLGPIGALLSCTPMPAESTTQVIGPEGGTLRVGPHRLLVPAGALDTAVTITAVAPSDTVNRIVFAPHGLELAQPARLIMSYANCGVVQWLLPKRIAYTTDQLVILDLLASLDNPLARRVSADLDHFSTYAVAW